MIIFEKMSFFGIGINASMIIVIFSIALFVSFKIFKIIGFVRKG